MSIWWLWVHLPYILLSWCLAGLVGVWISRYYDRYSTLQMKVFHDLIWPVWLIVVFVSLLYAIIIKLIAGLDWLFRHAIVPSYNKLFRRPVNLLARLLMSATKLPDNLVFKLSARLIQEDEYGKLWEHIIPSDRGRLRRVEVRDSTGTYYIRVDPRTQTAKEGVADSYGMRGRQLDESIRV